MRELTELTETELKEAHDAAETLLSGKFRPHIEVSGPAEDTAQLAGSGDDRTAAGGRLALVPRAGSTRDSGTDVTGA